MILENFEFNITDTTLPEIEPDEKALKNKDIDYIILEVEHKEFNTDTPSHLIGLMGKPMVSYLKQVCDKTPQMVMYEGEDNLISTIKPYLTNSEWVVVLYSDTPLLTYKTLAESFIYTETHELNVSRLARGYIFKTEYIKRVNRIFAPACLFDGHEDFTIASNFVSLANISKIMKNRILNKFMENGVNIIDPDSTYIESLVTIGKNSIIYPNACIMGDSHIGENSTVGYESTIKNSVIGNKCNIQNSLILSSVIMDSSLIEQSTIENNSLVEKNCLIKQYSVISSSKVGENSKVCWARVRGVEMANNTKLEN